nr:MAG TPA: hypothetical protein [Caudoviricetes sp.]
MSDDCLDLIFWSFIPSADGVSVVPTKCVLCVQYNHTSGTQLLVCYLLIDSVQFFFSGHYSSIKSSKMLYNSDSVDGRLCLLLIIQMQIFSNFSAVILKKQNIKI